MLARPRRRCRAALGVLAALTVVAATGCGRGSSGSNAGASSTTAAPTTAPAGGITPALLDRRAFRSQQVTGHDLAPATTIHLSFDGQTMGANAGCNSLSGPYAVSGGRLRWTGAVATTEIGCASEREAQDRWLGALLRAGAQASLENDNLVLRAGAVTLTLVDERVTNPDRPLVGTAWRLETIADGDTASSLPAGVAAPTLEFTDDGRVAVFAGCNRGTATVTVSADGVGAVFGPLALTRMLCGEAADGVESSVAAVLDGEVGLALDGTTLTITKADRSLTYRAA